MDGFLKNLKNMKETHTDVVDYEKFCSMAIKHIKSKDSFVYHKPISEALTRFRNKDLISICYRFIYVLPVMIDIPHELLKRHFRKSSLRRYMFPIIEKYKLSIFDKEIKRMLYDPYYECASFFTLLRSRKRLLYKFLTVKDVRLVYKQLKVIIHTRVFYNMDYFLKFFGAGEKSIAFLCFEAFLHFISHLKKLKNIRSKPGKSAEDNRNTIIDPTLANIKKPRIHVSTACGDQQVLYKSAVMKIIDNNQKPYIKIQSPIIAASIENFAKFFSSFMEERESLSLAIHQRQTERVKNILAKYVNLDKVSHIPDSILVFNDHINDQYMRNDLYSDSEEQDFHFLFEGDSFKQVTDCIEF